MQTKNTQDPGKSPRWTQQKYPPEAGAGMAFDPRGPHEPHGCLRGRRSWVVGSRNTSFQARAPREPTGISGSCYHSELVLQPQMDQVRSLEIKNNWGKNQTFGNIKTL